MNTVLPAVLPGILFEDEHLLVINKPAGMNTHAPGPFAGEGVYDWLRNREQRWANLAIIHRLDKETSGVMVFGKTTAANQSLTRQFTERRVAKKYLLLTDRPIKKSELKVKSNIARAGARYVSQALGEPAETRFRALDTKTAVPRSTVIAAEPFTGRTHQIRVHAAESGFPILGDTLYGGSPFSRVCLHASELTLHHPVSGKEMTFASPIDFTTNISLLLRAALIDPAETNAFRILHGASDGSPGWYVDRLDKYLVSQSESDLSAHQSSFLQSSFSKNVSLYHKTLNRRVRQASVAESSPRLVSGETAPERFSVRENGIEFELGLGEGYSVGLFLDQRDNRRRLLTGYIAPGFLLYPAVTTPAFEVLNAFAYTCGFSVCAAKAGAKTTSLDLSRKYLDWGRRNFALNKLDAAAHDFIYGDVFDWFRRLKKKALSFDAILLDPPTFSQSKEHGAFRVEKDYASLVSAALPLIKPGGVLFASTNASDWAPDSFVQVIDGAIRSGQRKILKRHYAPQPPDFPVSRSEPAYLKTLWLRIE